MKIPAIRSQIGDWTYYISSLTFSQIASKVEKIDDRLHQSKTLSDLIQRSITDNYLSISQYILSQNQRFFNSIVLAVYDDYPQWKELKIEIDDEVFYSIGLLEFPGPHKIFPVDGQHRVEGIKEALNNNPELAEEKVSVIFIGHKNNVEGKERTRRLFTTLNRYAKPVSLNEIIALDEDDIVAINTRHQLENHQLFMGDKVINASQKGINETNWKSFTSVITLYQCNLEVFKPYFFENQEKRPTKKNISEFLKKRRSNEEIEAFRNYCDRFWDLLIQEHTIISSFLDAWRNNFLSTNNFHDLAPAYRFRNREDGGNLLFRPVSLEAYVKAVIEIHSRTQTEYGQIHRRFNLMDFTLLGAPWKNVLWNASSRTMLMGNAGLVKLLLIYLYDHHLLTPKERTSIIERYSDKLNYEQEPLEGVLENIPQY